MVSGSGADQPVEDLSTGSEERISHALWHPKHAGTLVNNHGIATGRSW